jgi:hypothetical protein
MAAKITVIPGPIRALITSAEVPCMSNGLSTGARPASSETKGARINSGTPTRTITYATNLQRRDGR